MPDSLPGAVLDAVIDVSHNNGAIDWAAVAGAGIALAFVKASEGAGFIDPRFAENKAAAIAAGIEVVPYHFVSAVAPAELQSRHFLQTIGIWRGPTMLDWETAADLATVLAIGAAVSNVTGRDPVGYYGFSKIAAADAALSRWPLMLPEYPHGERSGVYADLVSRPPRVPPGRDPARPYDFHQYTPNGRIAGIAGPVDRSVWAGARDELLAWCKTGARPATF